jgi:hypothetical protein
MDAGRLLATGAVTQRGESWQKFGFVAFRVARRWWFLLTFVVFLIGAHFRGAYRRKRNIGSAQERRRGGSGVHRRLSSGLLNQESESGTMTGSQTERVTVPAYQSAVAILIRLASPIFAVWQAAADGGVERASYKHWFTLRSTAAVFLGSRSTQLSIPEREALVGALRYAHELAHDFAVCPRVEHCECETARLLVDLSVLQVADLLGVSCAA